MDSLPSELISYILGFLSVYERRLLSEVNTTFNYASLDPTLLKDETFAFQTKRMGFVSGPHHYQQYNIDNFEDVISKSKRKIFSIKIKDLNNNLRVLTTLKKISNRIVSLYLNNFTMTDIVFNFITSCDNLKTLQLENMKISAFSLVTCKPLLKLKSLIFIDDNQYLRELNIILFFAPNLVDLNFEGNCSSFSSQLVLNYLNNAKNINSVELAFNAFLCLPEHIKLRALVILNMGTLLDHDYEKFISILSRQILLENLKLSDFPCCLLVAISKLHNLKYLNLLVNQTNCLNTSSCLELFLNSMSNMKDIKTLIINISFTHFSNFESCAIQDNILKSLTTLDCSIINCSKIVKFCKNLTNLTVRNSDVVKYSYSDLKLIIETLPNLTHLFIRMYLDEDIFLRLPLSNIKGLITLKILGCQLTFECLSRIQFARLEKLTITYIKVEKCHQWEKVKDIWKELGRSNPALINLDVIFTSHIELYKPISTQMEHFINIEQLRPSFPRINFFGWYHDYLGIIGR